MGLNDQVTQQRQQVRERFNVFKDGVTTRNMGGKDPIYFRLLPALNPNNPDKATSYIPFVDPDGNLTDWACLIYMSRFNGHGSPGQSGTGIRRDIVSMKTANLSNYCPLDELIRAVKAGPLKSEWGYLVADTKGPDGKSITAKRALNEIKPFLAANILDINKPEAPVVGIFSTGVTDGLINPKKSIILSANPQATEEQIAQNYLIAYAAGDVTDPKNGIVFEISQENVPGKAMQSYAIGWAKTAQGQIIRKPVSPVILEKRVDMSNPANVIKIPATEQELIDIILSTFNGVSPSGVHEWVLMKTLFGQRYAIPEPPKNVITVSAKTASAPSVEGFGNNPAAYTAPTTPQEPAQSKEQVDNTPPWASKAPAAPKQPVADAATAGAPKSAIPGDPVDTAALMGQLKSVLKQ